MVKQVSVRIPDDLAAQFDDLISDDGLPTVADAVGAALRQLIERRLDEAIVAGYRRHPPTPAETAWADSAGRDLIAEEPWCIHCPVGDGYREA